MMSRFTLMTVAGVLCLCFSTAATAKDPISPVSLLIKEQNKHSQTQKNYVKNERSIDTISIDLKTDKARCEDIEKVLTDTYGPATSNRHNLRIWELPNTDKVTGQSKMITIMAGEENGRYFVKLDRKGPTRGNNPRLYKAQRGNSTNSLPKIRALTNQKTRPSEHD